MGAAMAAANDTLPADIFKIRTLHRVITILSSPEIPVTWAKSFYGFGERGRTHPGTKHMDVGATIYKPQQRAGAGGSGCACAALGYWAVIKEMYQGRYCRVLALATGALFSPLSYQQGDSIAGIAHAIVMENP